MRKFKVKETEKEYKTLAAVAGVTQRHFNRTGQVLTIQTFSPEGGWTNLEKRSNGYWVYSR